MSLVVEAASAPPGTMRALSDGSEVFKLKSQQVGDSLSESAISSLGLAMCCLVRIVPNTVTSDI